MTGINFLNMAFSCLFQSLSQHGLSKTLVYTYTPVYKFKPWFKQNRRFCVETVFLHNELFYRKTVLYTNTMFYTKNNVLAGPVQGLFAAYRIALSMVAGGTRRRRLNRLE